MRKNENTYIHLRAATFELNCASIVKSKGFKRAINKNHAVIQSINQHFSLSRIAQQQSNVNTTDLILAFDQDHVAAQRMMNWICVAYWLSRLSMQSYEKYGEFAKRATRFIQ